jgi:hypothetical protein
MKIYANMPRQIVDGWISSTERRRAGDKVEFHYHKVEEWLEVLTGDMSFFTLGQQQYHCRVGQVLNIPRGEVHRVEVGTNGVEYQMWLPVPASGESFEKLLARPDVDLILKNLDFPKREDAKDAAFFSGILSDQLTFCGVDGKVLDKKGFIDKGFVNLGRASSGSVRVLNRKEGSLLLSTVVTVADKDGPSKSFTNVRLFVEEKGDLRCRVWVNYREYG